jgi:hypothetical protein
MFFEPKGVNVLLLSEAPVKKGVLQSVRQTWWTCGDTVLYRNIDNIQKYDTYTCTRFLRAQGVTRECQPLLLHAVFFDQLKRHYFIIIIKIKGLRITSAAVFLHQ